MIVKCSDCEKYFDDEYRTTICPHETFPANDGENRFVHHPESYLSVSAPPYHGTHQEMTPLQLRLHTPFTDEKITELVDQASRAGWEGPDEIVIRASEAIRLIKLVRDSWE